MSERVQHNPVQRLFDLRVRGFRLVEIVAGIILVATIGFVYVAKTGAAEEADRIAELEGRVRVNQQRVRLLRAEVASLERPERIEALSEAAGLAPVAPGRQASEARLSDLARVPVAEDAVPGLEAEPATALVATVETADHGRGPTNDERGGQ